MISQLLFDHSNPKIANQRVNAWFYGAVILVVGYFVFGLTLISVQSVSKGGFIFAALASLWVLVGVGIRTISFPPVLFLPVAYFLFLALTGLQVSPYPIDYMLRMITVWVAAVSLAVFVANGLSINFLLFGFFIVFAANMAAIYTGYDGALINKADFDVDSLKFVEVQRYSGLAGQQNLLLSLIFTLPFLFFTLRKR